MISTFGRGYIMISESKTLIIPVVILFFGVIMFMNPFSQNWIFGYKTKQSMKNNENWVISQRLAGAIWIGLGIIQLSIILCLRLLNQLDYWVNLLGETFLGIEALTALCIPLMVVELTLYKINKEEDDCNEKK